MKTLIQLLVLVVCLYLGQAVQCPDGNYCDDGNTCCKLTSGGYGCCPYPSATCCSDGVHCCPSGYTCDVSAGLCNPNHLFAALHSSDTRMRTKIPATKKTESVEQCPSGQTQCPAGCCPLPNAVCCSDNQHCCPNGYTCDPPYCVGSAIEAKSLTKIAVPVKVEQCPSGQTECPAGCCPLPNAVCCSDNQHCCPQGTTCDPPYCIGIFDKKIKFPRVPLK